MSTPDGGSYPVRQFLPEIPVACYAGTELRFTVPVLNASGTPANVINLLAARAQVRTRWESVELLHSWTTDTPSGMTIGGGAAAGVTIIATGQETATWQA